MSTSNKTLWTIDPAHSEITFKAKHMVISTVTGNFQSFEGRLEAEGDNFENAAASFTADIGSISTDNEQRDNHLKSDDFFNAEEFPQLTFESTSVSKKGENEYDVTGDLTIRDVTKEVTLHAVHGGTIVGLTGAPTAGFEISGNVNRKDFGLKWDGVTEAGNVVVSDKIKLQLDVELLKNE